MPTWNEIVDYCKEKYGLENAEPTYFELRKTWSDGRTQEIVVRTYDAFDESWLEFVSPVCKEDELSPRAALRKNAAMAIGALALNDKGYYQLQYAVRLASLDMDEFEKPLHILLAKADDLELELTGENRY